jgi:polyhydroxyalkanoate synthesis regulator protein
MVLAPKRTPNQKAKHKKEEAIGRQTDLFSGAMQQPYTPPKSNGATKEPQINGKKQEAIGDLFSQINGMAKLISQPFPLLIPFPNLLV